MSGQTLQKAFCPLPGGSTAVYTSSGLAYYRHADWLGSSRFASTPSRTKYFDVAYAPYGEDYADSGTTDLSFTGQNQDTVSGMYDFLYREYHANSGRWIQPDPAGLGAAKPSNPQSWNRYAYVGNSPLTAVDPLGLFTHSSDAVQYLRGLAHTAAFYSRFEFTLVDEFGGVAERDEGRLPNTWLDFAGNPFALAICCSGPFEISGTSGPEKDPCNQGTPQVANAPNVPPASPELQDALDCISSCTGNPLLVTSTSRVTAIHPANTPHGRGLAADIGYIPGITNLFMQCAGACGAQFALDEALHPSPNATGPHFHIQLVPGLNGGHGDLPRNNNLECR